MTRSVPIMIFLFLISIPAVAIAQNVESPEHSAPAHRFWDKQNIGLFAGVAGTRMMDYCSTQYFRRRGNNEALLTNNIVDNKPLFTAIELSGTAASMGISYLFHATGHHKLERWTSVVHIGITTFGFSRNYLISRGNPVLRR